MNKRFLKVLIIFSVLFTCSYSGWLGVFNSSLGVREVEAAITYVGTAEGSGNSASYSVSLTGISMQQGDIVIVSTGFVSISDLDPGVSTGGYVEVADLYASDTDDANLSVNWKIMGSTPDTSVTCLGSGTATNGAVCVVHVWRGVDQSTPLDVTTVTAVPGNNIGTSIPNSGPITPVRSGAIVIATGLGADAAGDTAITAPTGYGNQADISVDPGLAAILGIASKAWSGSGAEDPAVWTNWTSTAAGSWVAVTLALRPAIDLNTAVEVHGGGAQSNFNLNPLNDTLGEKFTALKFQISDKATSDALPTLIDQIVIPISGTGGNASTDIVWAELYNDTAGSQVATAASITNSAITFGATPNAGGTAGLTTVASAGTVGYSVNIYMKNSALTATDGQTYIFGVNDSNIGEDTNTVSSSQMRADASAVSSVTGTNTVTHSKIIFSTQPPSTASVNTDFTGTVSVTAMDANNNIDTGFIESVTLSSVIDTTHTAPIGSLSSTDSGGLTKTATNGVATWTDLKHSSSETIDIKAVSTTYTSGIYSTAVTVSGPTITVASSVSQPPYVAISTNDIVLGAASISVAAGSSQVTAITLKENSGTIDADTEMANIELWISSDQSWDAGDNQLDGAKTFNGVDGEAVFTETFSVNTTPQYLIVRGDIGSLADIGDTIEIQIKTVSSSDAISGTPLNIVGTSTVWNKRMQLTFNNSGQAENLTNIPVLIKLNSERINYADVGKSDGTDLRFIDSDNLSELRYEIEKWDTASQSYLWVKVPQINASSNTDHIWLYYGNSGATSGPDPTNVWTNGYEAVYHLAETTGVFLDSTANNHDSDYAALATSTRPATTTGSIGNAASFGGLATHHITFPDSAGWDMGNLTMEAYIQPLGTGTGISTGNGGFGTAAIYPLLTKGLGEAESEVADVQFFMGLTVSPNYKIGSDYENWISNTPDPSKNNPVTGTTTLGTSGSWYYVAVKNSPTDTVHKAYVGGVTESSTTTGTYIPSKNGTQKVGIGVGVSSTNVKTGGFNGYMDEVRISNVGRSDAWIAANQLSLTDTFITSYTSVYFASISSAASQSFYTGSANTPISTITVSDGTEPTITTTNDIRIKIPSGVNMTWDTSDTTATIGGDDSSKVSTTVSYPDSKTLLIDVTSDFTTLDFITISGLSFGSFTATSSPDNLDLVTGGSGGSVVDTDDKTISIIGPIISSSANQSFAVDGSATSSKSITITEGNASITATNNIRVKIPTGFNMTWDSSDTSIVIATASPILSTYVEQTFDTDFGSATIDLSGITYNPITNTVLGVINGVPTVEETTLDGTHVRTITLTGFIDTEGIEWMYGTTYAFTQERTPYDIVIIDISTTTTSVNKANGTIITQAMTGITFTSNLGYEGISYDEDNNWFYVVGEKPAAGGAIGVGGGRVWKIEMDGTATEYTTLQTNLLNAGNTDLADIHYDKVSGHLFLLSEEADRITEATTDGTLISSIQVDSRFTQPEGFAFSPDNNYMFVTSEPNDYQLLRRPTASTTVTFEDSNKTMVIDVEADFLTGSVITISGMSFTNFSAPSSADNLELEILNNGETQAIDDKTITITGVGGSQSLTFSISDSTIGFGSLSSANARYATGNLVGSTTEAEAHTLSASTNANGGYILSVKGLTLTHSANSAYTINAIGGTNTSSATNTEQFGLRATISSGNGTVSSPYSASGFAYGATATTTSQIASGSGDDSTTIYSMRYISNIGTATEAGSYNSTLTYIVTATF